MAVSFSGTAFGAVNPSVNYGPSSTSSSIASNIAALITKNYVKYGLSAKAFGPNIVYSGNTILGTVSNVTTGPSYTTDGSPAAGAAAAVACRSSQSSRYYGLAYRAYIPVDNLPGPTTCSLSPLYGLDYLGDTSAFSATKYRLQETAIVSTSPSGFAFDQQPTPKAGKTVNFATTTAQYQLMGGGPLPQITLSQFKEPNPFSLAPNPGSSVYQWEGLCNPPYENQFGYADLSNVGGTSSSTTANAAVTEFKGLASDPLEPQIGGIAWDITVSINTSNNTATINGYNTCYPAHQIRFGSVLIYDSQPAQNTTLYLSGCLVGSGMFGSSNPGTKHVNGCQVLLDGSQAPCKPQ